MPTLNMQFTEHSAYLFMLSFILLRMTRGYRGVVVVSEYILSQWAVFATNFESFCKGLVSHCRSITDRHGQSYLAHNEGLHTGLSGMNFLQTLLTAECRKRIVSLAKKCTTCVTRLLQYRGNTALRVSEITRMGDAFQGSIVLAIHQGVMRKMGAYNAMDCMRAFVNISECVLRNARASYSEDLHEWYLRRQAKKYVSQKAEMLQYFGVLSAASMRNALQRMRKALGESCSVCEATMYVLFCETRQAVNKYGIPAVAFMLEKYADSPDLQAVVSRKRDSLLTDDRVSEPHTLQVLEAIRSELGMSVGMLRKQRPRVSLSVQGLCFKVGSQRICPKVCVEGIPEWKNLEACISTIVHRLTATRSSYADTLKAARSLGLAYYNKDGKSRKSKRVPNVAV